MRKKRSSPIQKQYRYEEKSNAYLIEVSLDDYDDVYKNYYGYMMEKIRKSKIRLRKRTISYLLLATLFLTPGYFFQIETSNVVYNVLEEGILIGGWVFLWEFFTNLFIKSREINSMYQIYERLYDSEIQFIYEDPKFIV